MKPTHNTFRIVLYPQHLATCLVHCWYLINIFKGSDKLKKLLNKLIIDI